MSSAAILDVEPRDARPGVERPRHTPRWRNATRRRLFVALSLFALAFVLALLHEVWRLDRIEKTLGEHWDHAEQSRRALELENAVRNQYAHQAHFVVGDTAHLSGERDARERARELTRTLLELVDEPEERRLLEDIRASADELDREFMDEIVPAVMSGKPAAMLMHDKSYAHVAVMETRADQLFEHVQRETLALRDEVQRLEDDALRWTLVLMATAPLFAVAVALYLGRSVARPLALLGDGAAKVARGDLDARIDLGTEDEFGILASEFNAMTAALGENQRKLVMNEKLAGIGRLAAGFAHEMNNPLTVLLGFAKRRRHEAKAPTAEELDIEEREILRCRDIVQDLLDLARPADTRGGPVGLREVCDEVVNTLRLSGNLKVDRAEVEGAATALGVREKLRQVVVNLLKNAAEATGPSGRIDLRIAEAGEWVELTVDDDGPGVSAEARAQLFEPFFTTKPDGTGLGLAICRSIVHAHGGEIEVGHPERGASFKVRLRNAETVGEVP